MKLLDCKILNMDRFGVENGFQPTDALFYILDGSFSLTVDGDTKIISKNDLVAFPHDMLFERHIISTLKFYFIKLEYGGQMPQGVLLINNRMRLLSSLSFILEAINSKCEISVAEYFLNDIFMQIKTEKLIKQLPQDSIVESVIRYFKENLKEKITLCDVAKAQGISVSGLIGHFKTATGQTPMRYLTDMRLRIAEEMLVTTDATLSDIAESCGYDNSFYLSNAFKKEKGESPRSFRQKHRF